MFKRISFAVGFVLFGSVAATAGSCEAPPMTAAQAAAATPVDRISEYQRLLECARRANADTKARLDAITGAGMGEFANRMEAERDRLDGLVTERTLALNNANAEIAALLRTREQLSLALRQANAANDDAKVHIAALTDARDELNAALFNANAQITQLTGERDQALAQIKTANDRIAALQAEIDRLNAAAKDGDGKLADMQDRMDQQAKDDSDKLAASQAQYDAQIAALQAELDTQAAAAKEANDKLAALKADRDQLAGDLDRAKTDLASITSQIHAANANLTSITGERDKLTADLKAANDQIIALQAKIDELNGSLASAAADNKRVQAELDAANTALAAANADKDKLAAELADAKSKMDALADERSLFFTRLGQILGNRPDIRVIGDRFVFQSEVLFATGKATLDEEGRNQIIAVAGVVKQIEAEIPATIKWVLQVNGHTDIQPILRGSKFGSNFELSTARALSVVELLQQQGVQPQHLAAAGFGEFQPLESGKEPEVLARNRRIELKLTDEGATTAE